MTRPILADAFDHHIWATLRVLDACAPLSDEQLATSVPGTFGSILDTLRHLVGADCSYLELLSGGQVQPVDEESMDVAALRAAIEANGPAGRRCSSRRRTRTRASPGTATTARPPPRRSGSGWRRSSTTARTIASQIATALTTLGHHAARDRRAGTWPRSRAGSRRPSPPPDPHRRAADGREAHQRRRLPRLAPGRAAHPPRGPAPDDPRRRARRPRRSSPTTCRPTGWAAGSWSRSRRTSAGTACSRRARPSRTSSATRSRPT